MTLVLLPRARASSSWRSAGCLRGCSARAWVRSPRSRPTSTSPRATASSTRSTTRSFPPSAGTAPPGQLWSTAPTPLPPTSSPGCCTSTLEAAGVGVRVGVGASCTFSAPEPRTASARSTEKVKWRPPPAPRPRPSKFEVRALRALPSLVRGLRGNDLLIALEKPPPAENEALSIGIAGRGFDGNLTSDSTRLDGYVLSHRHRADDPRPLRHRRALARCPGSRSAPRARSTPAAVESLGRADGGDPRAARPGDRLRAARLVRRCSALVAALEPRRGWRGRACGWPASRSSTCRWSSCSAPRSSRARASNSCWRSSARRCSPLADAGGARRLPGARRWPAA